MASLGRCLEVSARIWSQSNVSESPSMEESKLLAPVVMGWSCNGENRGWVFMGIMSGLEPGWMSG